MNDYTWNRQPSAGARPITPSDIHLPPTQPIDVSALIAAELLQRAVKGPPG
ncbi:hypothetical protein NQ152_01550 [Microbacterium sp. zg.B48]|uniref:hypothetical protein n=1 Tax=unclassified Microbacterium TaxID=2609290 RepID=UPI00214B963B|nr:MULTISPECIES: hypothetical protein [unclassified Microbacterium]MCR2762185.1 hypothetical protein [Microbacterium sp. zg.B48]MCR2809808.1 hypothetical protein [Microbacterium sp. zg.B185]WIM17881.1 hypothetical protein QNO12_09645 [Microbacterium sp. zg-B185]